MISYSIHSITQNDSWRSSSAPRMPNYRNVKIWELITTTTTRDIHSTSSRWILITLANSKSTSQAPPLPPLPNRWICFKSTTPSIIIVRHSSLQSTLMPRCSNRRRWAASTSTYRWLPSMRWNIGAISPLSLPQWRPPCWTNYRRCRHSNPHSRTLTTSNWIICRRVRCHCNRCRARDDSARVERTLKDSCREVFRLIAAPQESRLVEVTLPTWSARLATPQPDLIFNSS